MEKNLIEALEKLEKLANDKVIETYEIHRERDKFYYVLVVGSIEGYGSCKVDAELDEIDNIPEAIKEALIF